MDYTEDEMKDFYYTAVRMNTEIDYKVMREMYDTGLIKSHRDFYELAGEPLNRIKEYTLSDRSERLLSFIPETLPLKVTLSFLPSYSSFISLFM